MSVNRRQSCLAVAVCAALLSAAQAQDSPAPVNSAPVTPADAPPRKPLMMALDKIGVAKPLDDLKIDISGFVEASWTHDASNTPNNFINGRVFDVDNQDLTLNQLDLTIRRPVDASVAAKDNRFDLGFTVETIYGGDARFIHGNGANFYGSASPQFSPDEQLDIVQAYADIALPIGNGLRIQAGKMVTHMGYEYINPTLNPFYSHTYMFGYAIPYTHTGVMAFYNVNDNLTVMAGISRGWNQELKDNNGDAIDFLGQVSYKLSDKTQLTLNTTIGPEAAGDPGNWWWVFDGIITHKLSDQLSIALNADWGYYEHGSTNGTQAQWYGVAAYAAYQINDMFTVNARAEWYNDPDGFTVGGFPNTYYEATLGVAVKPFPSDAIGKNLVLRPEVRWDYSDQAFFDGGTKNNQFTFGVDAIFSF